MLIRVGILGPAMGGQCIFDFPLLTALNLCSLQMSGLSFSSLNKDENPRRSTWLKQLLGIPYPGSEQIYRYTESWVKRIEYNLGPLYSNELLKLGIVENQGKPTELRYQIGPEKEEFLKLDQNLATTIIIEGRSYLIKVLDSQSISIDIDESKLTLAPIPPLRNEHHIFVDLDQDTFLVKSGSSLVKSSLLEIANQIAPSLIPNHLTGDISTPKLIPLRESRLPLPYLKTYQAEFLLMGAGPIRIQLDLCKLTELGPHQINIFKDLFDHTFYHPELKKIFGS